MQAIFKKRCGVDGGGPESSKIGETRRKKRKFAGWEKKKNNSTLEIEG
jgi:hypothetical protein